MTLYYFKVMPILKLSRTIAIVGFCIKQSTWNTTHREFYQLKLDSLKMIKGEWKYLYRALDEHGNTIDFYLSKRRNAKAAKLFLKKLINNNQIWAIAPIVARYQKSLRKEVI
jgi:hypothetical protein